MVQKFLVLAAILVFAGGVLITSILRTVTPSYAFSPTITKPDPKNAKVESVDYYLAYPGILPDHFLWPVKAARDKAWLFLTTDPAKRAELLLLLADKRLGAANALVEGGKTEKGLSAATRAEKYLEEAFVYEEIARNKGADVNDFLDRLALATLKHRETLEELNATVSDEFKPTVAQAIEYPVKVWKDLKGVFSYLKKPLPASPFEE